MLSYIPNLSSEQSRRLGELLDQEREHCKAIIESLRSYPFPDENLRLSLEFELRDPKTADELEYAPGGKCLVVIFSLPGIREEVNLITWRQDQLQSEDVHYSLFFTKYEAWGEILCHLRKIYADGGFGEYIDDDGLPDPMTLLYFRSRPRGGSEPVVKLTDQQHVEFSETCQKLLPKWRALIALFSSDPEGDEWRRYARRIDAPDWLLREVAKPKQRQPRRLAYFHSAAICGVGVLKRPGQFISLSTLERIHARGKKLAAAAKPTTKAETKSGKAKGKRSNSSTSTRRPFASTSKHAHSTP